MRSLTMTTTLVLAFAACADQPGMMNAEFPSAETPAAALDRAAAAATMKDDERYAVVLAVLDRLFDEHPGATGGRVNPDGIFGGAYPGETVTHAGVSLERVSAPRGSKGTPTRSRPQDLQLTGGTEAVLSVGLLHAHPDGQVEDHIYDVRLVRDDGAWSAELTYKGHFDGAVVDGS